MLRMAGATTPYDFFPFAGIYRPVVLYSIPQAHIEAVTGVNGGGGTVQVTARLNEPVQAQGLFRLYALIGEFI